MLCLLGKETSEFEVTPFLLTVSTLLGEGILVLLFLCITLHCCYFIVILLYISLSQI